MRKIAKGLHLLTAGALLIASCSKDEEVEPIKITIKDTYSIDRCKVLEVTPTITGDENATYLWMVNDPVNNRKDSTLSTTKELQFIAAKAGTYDLSFTVTKPGKIETRKVQVKVADTQYLAGVSEVVGYSPSVGYMVNDLFFSKEAKTTAEQLNVLNNHIKQNKDAGMNVYLGTFGGNATFKFDHTIVNLTNKKDFSVSSSYTTVLGTVWVAYDKNKNGKADDDEWYEIAGSEHAKSTTIRDFQMTFNTPSYAIKRTETISWSDSKGGTGDLKYFVVMPENSRYPQWLADQKLVLKGTRITSPGFDLKTLEKTWGYAGAGKIVNENIINDIDIDWAIDKNGKKVKLLGVDFVKIVTATFYPEQEDDNDHLRIAKITDLSI